jgi:hypothetical protein
MTFLLDLPDLLVTLGRPGVAVSIHPDDPALIRFRPMNIPPDLIGGLRAHKADLLTLLGPDGLRDLEDDPEAAYTLGERLGVADGLKMDTRTGSPAWLVAVGEAALATDHNPSPGERSRWR